MSETLELTKDTSGWRQDPVLSRSYRMLQAMVPARSQLKAYVGRGVLGYDDLSLLDAARSVGHNVLLTGPTGSGKTYVGRAYAAQEREAYGVMACNGAADLRKWTGKHLPAEDGGLVWHDGMLTALVRFGGIGIFDEINMLRPDIAAGLYAVLRDRFVVLEDRDDEVVHAPHAFEAHECDEACGEACPYADHCDVCHDVERGLPHERFEGGHRLLFIGAMNEGSQYTGTRKLNAALVNRFRMHLIWEYEDEVEAELVKCPALLDLAGNLRDGVESGTLETETPTNALQDFEVYADRLGLSFAVGNFLNRFAAHERPGVEQRINLSYSALSEYWPEDAAEEVDTEAPAETEEA